MKQITSNLKYLCRVAGRTKAPTTCWNRYWALPKSGKFQLFGGRVPTPVHRLRWNFAVDPHACRCRPCQISRESVQWMSALRGENSVFRPLNKFNTGSLPLCRILPVKISCICSIQRWEKLIQVDSLDRINSHRLIEWIIMDSVTEYWLSANIETYATDHLNPAFLKFC